MKFYLHFENSYRSREKKDFESLVGYENDGIEALFGFFELA